MDPPQCIQNAMMTKDKKPFTYTPGGINLSEIKSPRLGRRIERNANYGAEPEAPRPQPAVRPTDLSNLPPSTLVAMQPQMHVQVLPSGQVPTLPSKHGPHPPPPPAPPAPKMPPPPPLQPLPTQKVMTSENQVVERPDMTKIIPENPMALLRKTGGPQPRNSLIDQLYNETGNKSQQYQQPQSPQYQRQAPQYQQRTAHSQQSPQYQQQSPQYQQQSPQYPQQSPQYQQQSPQYQQQSPQYQQQSPQYQQKQLQNRQPQSPQYQNQQRTPPVQPVVQESPRYQPVQRNDSIESNDSQRQPGYRQQDSRPRQFSPPVKVIERQPEPARQQDPPLKTSTAHLGSLYIPPANQQQQNNVQTTPPRNIRGPPTPPEKQHPEAQSPTTPTLNKAPRPWENKKQQEELPPWARKERETTPVNERPQPQSQPIQSPPPPTQRWAQGAPKSPSVHQQQVPGQQNQNERVLRVNIITHDENNQPCQPKAVIYDPVTGTERIQPLQMEPDTNNHPNAVFVTQPLVFQHPGGSGAIKIVQPKQSAQKGGNQGATRVIPVQIESVNAKALHNQSPATPIPAGNERSLNRQQSWGSNNPSQSNSFKVIQKITQTDGDDDDDDQPITEHSPKFTQQFQQAPANQFRKMKINEDDRNLMNRVKQVPRGQAAGEGNPKVRTIPIQIEGEPQKKYIPPSEQTVPEPKKYTGSAIPSRSFKILQAMTAPDSCAYANEVNENTNEPSNYPYHSDPHYPPPPYWYDPYYNPYYYPPYESEFSRNDVSAERETSKTPTNESENRKKEIKMNPRQTPVPFYYPAAHFTQRPLRTPTTDTESDSESSRRTPLPFWGYPPIYPRYPPTPTFIEESENKQQERGEETEQYDDDVFYPPFPLYWDPYYYPFYYGYPPPMYPPYPYYNYGGDTEESAGYSSTDEMAYYAQRFAQENQSQKYQETNKTPVTSLKVEEKSLPKEEVIHRKTENDIKYEEKIIGLDEECHKQTIETKYHEEMDEECSNHEKFINNERDSESEHQYTSDSEASDSDTEREQGRCNSGNQDFNPLHSLKSVTDISIYVDNENEENSSEEETTNSTNDDDSTYFAEEAVPHQLSVIFEESERTDTSKVSKKLRSSSVCSEASTIADRTEEIEDEICTAVNVKLPLRRKSKPEENDTETEVYTSVTLKSPSRTPKNERSPCRIEESKEDKVEVYQDDHEEGMKRSSYIQSQNLLKQINELENTLNNINNTFSCREKNADNTCLKEENTFYSEQNDEDDYKSILITDHKEDKQEKSIEDQNDTAEEIDFWSTIIKDQPECSENNKSRKQCDLNNNDQANNNEKDNDEADEIKANCEILSSDVDECPKEDENTDDSLDFWSIIKKDEDEVYTKKSRQSYWGQKDYDAIETYENNDNIGNSENNGDIHTTCDGKTEEETKNTIKIEESDKISYENNEFNDINIVINDGVDIVYERKIVEEENETVILGANYATTVENNESENEEKINLQSEETEDNKIADDVTSNVRKDDKDSAGSKNSSYSKSQLYDREITEEYQNTCNIRDNTYSESEEDTSSSSESSSSDSEDDVERKQTPEKEKEDVDKMPEPLSIKERIKALQESVRQKQNMFNKRGDEFKINVKEKVATLEVTEPHNLSKTTSTKSSLKSFEELSEEEVDSGVTSDMSRHISDSEEFPELGKMSRYQRAATHSRLFKLLQEGSDEDDDEEEQVPQPVVDKFSKLSVRRRQQEQEQTDNVNRRELLSLPLENPINKSSETPAVNEKLVDELIQSMLKQKKGKIFKSMSMNKLRAAAIKILQEDDENVETPEDLSSFMSPLRNSTDSTAVQTPQEFYSSNDYKAYYESWKGAENYDILPSKAFKLIQEHAGFNKTGIIAGLIAKCPRILSSKNLHKELLDMLENSDDSTPTPDDSLERNEVTSAS